MREGKGGAQPGSGAAAAVRGQPTCLPERKPERSVRSRSEPPVTPVQRVAGEVPGGPETRPEIPVTSLLGPKGRKQ